MNDILAEIKKEMGASNLDDADFLEMAEDFDNLTDADLDDMDDAEYAEYVEYMEAMDNAEKKHGKRNVLSSKIRARKGTRRSGAKKPLGPKKDKLKAVGGGGSFAPGGSYSQNAPAFGTPSFINYMMTRSKGDLNITITRQTANIAGIALPYILFGLNGYNSSYISTMKDYLPSGVTMVASTDSATGDVLLTYTAAGPLVDIVRISLTGSQISYSEFLQSMNSNFFKTRYIRQEYVNDSTLLVAVSQTINFGLLSALGMKNANNLLPRSRRLNSDFQTFIVNLFLPEQKITSDFSFVQKITATAGQTIAWDVFMSERTNLNNI